MIIHVKKNANIYESLKITIVDLNIGYEVDLMRMMSACAR